MKLDHLPIALCAALCAGLALFRLALPELTASPEALSGFVAEFTAFTRRERMLLFPLGVATSISTLVVLMRHGSLVSRRGRLLAAAAGLLFAAGLYSTIGGEPAVKEILRLAAAGSASGIEPFLSRWASGHWVLTGLDGVALACLLLASRDGDPAPAAEVADGTLSAHQRTLLFLLGTATLFHGYDTFIVSMALPYIGRDLAASESTLGFALSAIRIGALVSIVFGRIADRRGRRGLLLLTVLAYTVATGATGLSRGIVDFVLLQLVAQTFLVAEVAIAQVVIEIGRAHV